MRKKFITEVSHAHQITRCFPLCLFEGSVKTLHMRQEALSLHKMWVRLEKKEAYQDLEREHYEKETKTVVEGQTGLLYTVSSTHPSFLLG